MRFFFSTVGHGERRLIHFGAEAPSEEAPPPAEPEAPEGSEAPEGAEEAGEEADGERERAKDFTDEQKKEIAKDTGETMLKSLPQEMQEKGKEILTTYLENPQFINEVIDIADDIKKAKSNEEFTALLKDKPTLNEFYNKLGQLVGSPGENPPPDVAAKAIAIIQGYQSAVQSGASGADLEFAREKTLGQLQMLGINTTDEEGILTGGKELKMAIGEKWEMQINRLIGMIRYASAFYNKLTSKMKGKEAPKKEAPKAEGEKKGDEAAVEVAPDTKTTPLHGLNIEEALGKSQSEATGKRTLEKWSAEGKPQVETINITGKGESYLLKSVPMDGEPDTDLHLHLNKTTGLWEMKRASDAKWEAIPGSVFPVDVHVPFRDLNEATIRELEKQIRTQGEKLLEENGATLDKGNDVFDLNEVTDETLGYTQFKLDGNVWKWRVSNPTSKFHGWVTVGKEPFTFGDEHTPEEKVAREKANRIGEELEKLKLPTA